jgi:hypothetical protein
MTEAQIIAEIALIEMAISNILKTGQKYEVGSGASKRIFEAANIDSLRDYKLSLENKLSDVSGNSGILAGF